MKFIAIILLALSMFVSGMCVQGARDSFRTRNWINPDNIDVVKNPFWPPSQDQLHEERQADVAEGAQE